MLPLLEMLDFILMICFNQQIQISFLLNIMTAFNISLFFEVAYIFISMFPTHNQHISAISALNKSNNTYSLTRYLHCLNITKSYPIKRRLFLTFVFLFTFYQMFNICRSKHSSMVIVPKCYFY